MKKKLKHYKELFINYLKKEYKYCVEQIILFLEHLVLFVKPAIIAFTVAFIWQKIFWYHHIHASEHLEPFITGVLMFILCMLYGFTAGPVFVEVMGEYKTVCVCVKNKDVQTFLAYKDRRVPYTTHFLIGVFSFAIILSVCLFNYPDKISGFYFVGGVTFLMALWRKVCIELDDYEKGIWFRKKITPEFKVMIKQALGQLAQTIA